MQVRETLISDLSVELSCKYVKLQVTPTLIPEEHFHLLCRSTLLKEAIICTKSKISTYIQ
jgi:hypothetical protein